MISLLASGAATRIGERSGALKRDLLDERWTMARATVKALRAKVEELLALRAGFERYQQLEKEIKADMVKLKHTEMKVERGRVFISVSERWIVSPGLAREVLGSLAEKVIEVKETVSNELIKSLVKVGDISPAQREALVEWSEKTPVTSLYVRPLR